MRLQGVGVIPAIAVMGAAGAAGWFGSGALYSAISDWIASSEPVPPPPAVPHPNAPTTEHEMTTPGAWTPFDSAPTNVDWRRVNQENLDGYDPNKKDYSGWLLMGAVGIGALLLITAVKK